jgi:hypothetical protein
MEQKAIGLMITFAIVFLMGTIFVGVVSQQVADRTQLTTAATETIDFTAARLPNNLINGSYYFHLKYGCPAKTQWRTDAGCGINDVFVKNSTGDTLDDPTDYVFISNGAVCSGVSSGDFHFVNSETMNTTITNTSTVSYTYCADGYVSGWGATITNLVPGFLALAILCAIAFLIFYVLKSEGIDLRM